MLEDCRQKQFPVPLEGSILSVKRGLRDFCIAFQDLLCLWVRFCCVRMSHLVGRRLCYDRLAAPSRLLIKIGYKVYVYLRKRRLTLFHIH